jgi:mRNA interferase MazF
MVKNTRDNIPDSGDIVWLNFSPVSGHEQRGKRPALVITPMSYNRASGLCFVLPVTSREKGYPFEVSLPEGSNISGVVLVDQGRTVDWKARKAEKIESVSVETLKRVKVLLKTLLGIE